MGKLPAIFAAIVAIWFAWNLYVEGEENALSGIFSEPQYGEADRPTRSGDLADRVLEEGTE